MGEVVSKTLPKCPNCKKEIDHLDYTREENWIVSYEFKSDCTKRVVDSDLADIGIEKFTCPECGELLFESYRDAKRFFGRRGDE